MSYIPIFFKFIRFGIIGLLAAITHYVITMLLIPLNINVAIANLFGFLTAFWLSYFGHRIYTFRAVQTSHRQTLPRFGIVALIGFVFNETLLLSLHHFTSYSISFLLVVTIILTAVFTFFLNLFFAFRP